jgi:hypothetical protein
VDPRPHAAVSGSEPWQNEIPQPICESGKVRQLQNRNQDWMDAVNHVRTDDSQLNLKAIQYWIKNDLRMFLCMWPCCGRLSKYVAVASKRLNLCVPLELKSIAF